MTLIELLIVIFIFALLVVIIHKIFFVLITVILVYGAYKYFTRTKKVKE